MSGHFSGGCHFESAGEHERPFTTPSFNPYQAENREIFSQIQNNSFNNRGSYPFPEISINVGSEPPYMPGPGWQMPGPPRFFGRQEQWAPNYGYGNPYAFNGGYNYNADQNLDDNCNYNGYPNTGDNPYYGNNYPPVDNGAGPNYGYNQTVDNGGNPYYGNNYPSVDNGTGPNYGYNGGPTGNYNDGATYQPSYDSNGNPVAPDGTTPGAAPDLSESSYGDTGVYAPNTNNGSVPDAAANPAPGSDQPAGQVATPPATTNSADYSGMVKQIVTDVPLGTADAPGYITKPGDYTDNTDQTTNAAPTASDQTTNAAPTVTDQSTNAAPSVSDQSTNAAPTVSDQSTNTAPTVSDQSTNAAPTVSDQSTNAAPTVSDQTAAPGSPAAPRAESGTLAMPDIYGVPDMTNNSGNGGTNN